MADSESARLDVDIENDVPQIFAAYPPLQHDRNHLKVTVEDGVIKARGYVKNAQNRDILKREASKIEGIKGVDVSGVYDDGGLRIESGQVTPVGVYSTVSYGAVVLTGEKPEGMSDDELIQKVESIPGVRKVILNLR